MVFEPGDIVIVLKKDESGAVVDVGDLGRVIESDIRGTDIEMITECPRWAEGRKGTGRPTAWAITTEYLIKADSITKLEKVIYGI